MIRRMMWLALLGALLSPATLQAGTITNVTYSFALGSSNQVNPTGIFTGYNYIEPGLIYNDNLPIDFQVTVDGPGNYSFNEAPLFGFVQNLSGTSWTGFKIEITSGDATISTNTLFDTFMYSGPLTTPTFTNSDTTVTFTGASPVASNTTMAPVFGIIFGSAGTFEVRQTPLVPEPSSMALAGFGGVVLAAVGRRRFVRRSVKD